MAGVRAARSGRGGPCGMGPRLRWSADGNRARAGVRNVRGGVGHGATGWPGIGEVDVLVLSGSLPCLPKSLLDQVRIGGRLAAVVGDAPAMSAEIWRRTGEETWDTIKIFETVVKRLRDAPRVSQFVF